jgi:hypothetical protein
VLPISYLFLKCLKGQTTEKYLSMVREMVMYTLAVMLVWNRELKMMNKRKMVSSPEIMGDCRAQGTSIGC